MKKYITPELEINVIFKNDIMTLSSIQGDASSNNELSATLGDGFWG